MGYIVTTADPIYTQLGVDAADATTFEAGIVENSILWAEAAVRRYLRYDPVYRERTEYYPQIDLGYQSRWGILDANDTEAFIREVASAVTDELQLRHLPIRSVTSLYVDYDGRFGKRTNSFSLETLRVEGDDFWARYDSTDDNGELVCHDGILLSLGRWPSTPGSVKIAYYAGYTEAEFTGTSVTVDAVPIYEAVIFEAARKAKQALILSKNSGGAGTGSGTGWTAGAIQSEKLGDYSYSIGTSAGGTSSGGNGGTGGLYDGNIDIASESIDRLADYVNVGYALVG